LIARSVSPDSRERTQRRAGRPVPSLDPQVAVQSGNGLSLLSARFFSEATCEAVLQSLLKHAKTVGCEEIGA
jgi:hypothetical protein